MFTVLSGKQADPIPVVMHSWGDCKVSMAGIHPKFQYVLGGKEQSGIERAFHARFQPDWFHCGVGGGRSLYSRERRVEGHRAFVRSADGQRWIEVRDDYRLEPDPAVAETHARLCLTLESKSVVDAFFDASRTTVQDLLAEGVYAHVKHLADACGDTVFLAVNEGMNGLPMPYEDALIGTIENPDIAAHAVLRYCEQFLVRAQAARACGAHAYIISDGFAGSLGQLSPALEERVQVDAKRWLYAELRKHGLLPIGYWLGDVRPHIRWINSLGMAGLMIEEDKKGFHLDPLEIRKRLHPETCLFGNIDSSLLLRGTPDSIRKEVCRQRRAAAAGTFVFANGSPLVVGTPTANIGAYMQAARG